MEQSDSMELLKNELAYFAGQGFSTIPINRLRALVEFCHSTPSGFAQKEYEAKWADWASAREHSREWDIESFKAVIAMGQNAIRNIILINGGAAIALLAFIGHLVASKASLSIEPFADALMLFVYAVPCGALASALSYVSQSAYSAKPDWADGLGNWLTGAAILSGLSGLLLFVYGASRAYDGFVGSV